MPNIPVSTIIDIGSDNQQTAVKEVLSAKYNDATKWMQWGASLLDGYLTDIHNALGTDTVAADLSAVNSALAAIVPYTPSGSFTYTAPTAPTYTAVPTYSAPTLGTITAIPAVDAITIGAVPSTSLTFTNGDFTDTLLTALRARLAADVAGTNTGLGAAESALFARETARQNDARAKSYDEITTGFSSRGFDMPPGALLAKQTEANNESGIRLSDSSSQIMAESARLAVDYNKSVLSSATQMLDLLSRVFDGKVVRDFEAEKTRVTLALEGFKQTVSVALAKADLNKTAISATISANEGTVKVFQSQIEGQIAPMKAITETNAAIASAYSSAVQAASASLEAQIRPEELKLKGVQANAQIGGTKADLAIKEATIVIENARRALELEVQTTVQLGQAAQQVVASALNGVSVSSSLDFRGSAGYQASTGTNVNISYKAPDGTLPPTIPITG